MNQNERAIAKMQQIVRLYPEITEERFRVVAQKLGKKMSIKPIEHAIDTIANAFISNEKTGTKFFQLLEEELAQ